MNVNVCVAVAPAAMSRAPSPSSIAAARTAHDKTLLERQIAATDRQIDTLVYEIYGLTDDEIAIVEGSVNPAQ